MIKYSGILLLLACMSFSQVDYKQLALNDFKEIVQGFSTTKSYHLAYDYERYFEDELVQSSKGENIRYNNFYYSAFDSAISISTNTRDLVVDFGEKVMTYKYGYETASVDRKMSKMMEDVLGTIENAVQVSYEELDLERGKYTLLVTQGNTWKVEYEVNKVHKRLEKAHFFNYYPSEELNEQVVISYRMKEDKLKLKDKKYDFDHYIKMTGTKVTVSENFTDYRLQSLRIR